MYRTRKSMAQVPESVPVCLLVKVQYQYAKAINFVHCRNEFGIHLLSVLKFSCKFFPSVYTGGSGKYGSWGDFEAILPGRMIYFAFGSTDTFRLVTQTFNI